MNSQRLPSTATTAAFCTGSPGGNLPTATSPQRGSDLVRGCEASARGDSRHGAGRSQAGTRLVWWCQRRQQAAQISAAAASGFLVSHVPSADAAEHVSVPSVTRVTVRCTQFGTGPAHGCRLWRFGPFRRRKGAARQQKVTRVMILMSDTGGGHRASAQALQVSPQLFRLHRPV